MYTYKSGDKVIILDEFELKVESIQDGKASLSTDVHTVAYFDGTMVTLRETGSRYTPNQLKLVK